MVLGPRGTRRETDEVDTASARLFVERALDAGVGSPANSCRPSPPSAAGSTACPSPSSSPRPAPAPWRRRRSWPGWGRGSRCSPARATGAPGATAASPRPSSGPTGCCPPASPRCSTDWPVRRAVRGRVVTAVGADVGLDPKEAADALQLLVDSSLVSAEPAPAPARSACSRPCAPSPCTGWCSRVARDCPQPAGRPRRHGGGRILAAGARRWDTTVTGLLDVRRHRRALRWCLLTTRTAPVPDALAVLWGVVHQGHTDEIAELCEQVLARWPDPTRTPSTRWPRRRRPAAWWATRPAPTLWPRPRWPRRRLAHGAGDAPPRPGLRGPRRRGPPARPGLVRGGRRPGPRAGPARPRPGSRGVPGAAPRRAGRSRRRPRAGRRRPGEAAAVGSAINELWARSVEAHLHLRRDPGRARRGRRRPGGGAGRRLPGGDQRQPPVPGLGSLRSGPSAPPRPSASSSRTSSPARASPTCGAPCSPRPSCCTPSARRPGSRSRPRRVAPVRATAASWAGWWTPYGHAHRCPGGTPR